MHSLANEKIAARPPARIEVIVHGLDEIGLHGLARLIEARAVNLIALGSVLGRPAQIAHRRAQMPVRGISLGKAGIGKIERRAIVRLQHEQAQRIGVAGVEHVLEQQEVSQALRHLLGVDAQHARMHPVAHEVLVVCRLGLRFLVLVMRKDEVGATAVDIKRHAEILLRHGRAF